MTKPLPRLISVSNGILEPKHIRHIGPAIWMFLYLIDRVTREDKGVGIVLGGKPITDEEVAQTGLNLRAIRRHRQILLDHGYIVVVRTPRGYVYQVMNSQKFRYATATIDNRLHRLKAAAEMLVSGQVHKPNTHAHKKRDPKKVSDLGEGLTQEELEALEVALLEDEKFWSTAGNSE